MNHRNPALLEPESQIIKAFAQIVDLHADHTVLVSERQTLCGSCAAAKGCGVSLLSKTFGNKTLRFETKNIQSPRLGDWYEIGLPQTALLKIAATTYLIPLAIMIAAAIVASGYGAGDGIVAIASLAGLVVGYMTVHRMVSATRLNNLAQPMILGRVSIESGNGASCHVSR